MVNKVTFAGFRGEDCPNRPPPLDPPLLSADPRNSNFLEARGQRK